MAPRRQKSSRTEPEWACQGSSIRGGSERTSQSPHLKQQIGFVSQQRPAVWRNGTLERSLRDSNAIYKTKPISNGGSGSGGAPETGSWPIALLPAALADANLART
jgi:hypothetical protein